jgi:hypothetical protein
MDGIGWLSTSEDSPTVVETRFGSDRAGERRKLDVEIEHKQERKKSLLPFAKRMNFFLLFRKLKFFCLHKHIIDPLNNQFKCSLYFTARS